ncbi:hypothetical protein HBN50_04550 [Halobacteriovorax sp. GB3]|uniref:hypothetical protein n=1 Tax=Halobacteriovorax sp. GB3 TaxID=2719615 RepID=UPI00235EE2B5|nr:hypothetical protein [Halobacteriovorax sp. GB3]MDD0852353.1 hypothetical protein [Halobacteriovorax sp. GB3]
MIFQLVTVLLFSLLSFQSTAQVIQDIPLSGKFSPAGDLIGPDGEVLNSEEALALASEVDLASLNPKASQFWDGKDRFQLFSPLMLDSSEVVQFDGSISSIIGLGRFNIRDSRGSRFVVNMAKDLHTYLLRKAFLDKLGYKSPTLQYLRSITVDFDSETQKKNFLEKEVYRATGAVSKRWVVSEQENSVTLKDIFIYSYAEDDFYNAVYGVPLQYSYAREVRASALIYGLLDLKESANKFSWKMANINEDRVIFSHFFPSKIPADRYDARWILRRLAKLDRLDFEQIVESAKFPHSVSKLVLEKLLSRRNQLLKSFNVNSDDLPVNYEVSNGQELVDGILKKEKYEDYASYFSHGEPDNPFKDIEYYIYSELRGQALTELMQKVNEKLSYDRILESRQKWFQEDFQEGLDHYIETGEFKEKSIGTWFSPTASGKVILSRDMVMGVSGQNDFNLVQIADTFGVAVSLGGHLGIEGLDNGYGAFVKGDMSYLKTFTHLRPLEDLKEGFKEPYKKMLVNLSKYLLQKNLMALAGSSDTNERNELISKIDDLLDVGESLIVTTQITPKVLGNLNYSTPSGVNIGLATSTDAVNISRIHLYRESNEALQVYVDKGMGHGYDIAFNVRYFAPILRLTQSGDRGNYGVHYYRVPLKKKAEDKDDISAAYAVSKLLSSGETWPLDELNSKVLVVDNSYRDSSLKFSLLWWKFKRLKKNGDYVLKIRGKKKAYLLRESIERLRGRNYRSFIEDVSNFWLAKNDKDFRIRSATWKNPGHTPFGSAFQDSVVYEANLDRVEGRILNEFIKIKQGESGWKKDRKKLIKKINQMNKDFETTLFEVGDVYDATDLNLYDIVGHINIYDAGVKKFIESSSREIELAENRYQNSRTIFCNDKTKTIAKKLQCGDFSWIEESVKRCRRYRDEVRFKKYSKCTTKILDTIYRYLPMSVLIDLVKRENVYIYGTINGFRKDSEYIHSEIRSHAQGTIGSRMSEGPFSKVLRDTKMQASELFGSWMRENL